MKPSSHFPLVLPLAFPLALAAAAFLFFTTVAFAQSTSHHTPTTHPAAGSHASAAQPTATHAKSLAVNEQGSSCTAPCGGPMHPGKSTAAPANQSHTSPLYHSNNQTGNNPLYNGSKETKAPPQPASYKDPEDMTTRYRPGNNKTTTTKAPTKPRQKNPPPPKK